MNRFAEATCVAVLIATAAAAQAESMGPKTRDDVRRELAEAVRDGSLASGEAGLSPREQYPGRYPQPAMAPGRSRADVQAELEAARRSGDVVAAGETGLKANELFPSRYPDRPTAMGRTREQVRAERMEARRSGELLAPGEATLTLRELHPGQFPMGSMPVYAGKPAAAGTDDVH